MNARPISNSPPARVRFRIGRGIWWAVGSAALFSAASPSALAEQVKPLFQHELADNTPDNAKDLMPNPGLHTLAATAPPPTVTPAPQQMVDALYAAFGDHHSRAVHAKGIMAVGTFEPSQLAADLTTASIFSHGALPILVRFSDFTGIPQIPTISAMPIRAALRSSSSSPRDRVRTSSATASTGSRRRPPPSFAICCWRSEKAAQVRQSQRRSTVLLSRTSDRQNLSDNPKAAAGS